jgi:Prenyltransferase and squalene oxidase repeat
VTSTLDLVPSLADSFDLVAASLPAALIGPELTPELRRLTRRLAPLPRAGFEVRLGSSPRVDLQQWLTTRDHEPQLLREHVRRAGWSGPAAQRLDAFLARWSDPADPLHGACAELWLEFDRTARLASVELPPLSLFLALGAAEVADRLRTTASALGILTGEGGARRSQIMLERCFDACPDGAFVSHVGLMLGRPEPSLRVNVKRLEAGSLPGYVSQLGWPGPLPAAVGVFAELRRLVDRITVCLDIGAAVSPELGFECALDGQPPADPRWSAFLGELVERGWCAPAKREALLGWPGLTVPGEESGPWPAPLIRDELLRGVDHLSAFERRLGHVKVTLGRTRRPEAKAYFGYFHTWLRPALGHDVGHGRVGSGRAEDLPGPPIDRALGFLLAARTQTGWWRDFSGVLGDDRRWRAGTGDEWVTAYVGAAVAGLARADARRAGRRAWALLVDRRPPGTGWGFNRLAPPDADSTAWALRLAAALGQEASPPAARTRERLDDYILADGGLATYRDGALGPPAAVDSTGWSRTAHACVTAAAAGLGSCRALEFLRRSHGEDGSWSGYWWEDPEYTTALAAEALHATRARADQVRVEAAVVWALGRIGPDGSVRQSAFATALCVRILRLAHDAATTQDQRRRCLSWLATHQRPDGAWPPSARLRVPPPHVTNPARHEGCTTIVDDAGIFTAATVLVALAGEQP